MIDLDDVAKRLDQRDGYRVVSYREVALPVFRISCVLTFQEATPLGAIEEFTLRAVSRGIDTVSSLEAFLGLPAKIVVGQLGRLSFEGAITQSSVDPITYNLTAEGSKRIAAASSFSIVRQRIPLYFDGITRRLVPAEAGELWTGKSLEELGVTQVAPVPRQSPREGDIDLMEVNRIASLVAKVDTLPRRAVRLDAVVGKPALMFKRALALAYKSTDGRRVVLGFAIDGRQSIEHEIEYARNGGVERSPIFSTLLDADKRRKDIQVAQRELKRDISVDAGGKSSGERKTLSLGGKVAVVAPSHVRMLSVYDHPPLLRDAFASAVDRVLIVSPWIRANVVTEAFVRRLAECLDRGVRVSIGYGIGREDAGEREPDRRARESLEALSRSFENFLLVRKGNTHAKVLLVDSKYFVTTSFNWLSFSGDPRKPMREEEGTLIEDPSAVDAYYEKLVARFRPDGAAA